ncbi:MAG: MBL fold metallo-hydrolase, partial [Proteobacteria bacterium]|nr:MBL fold metallo-hydrolase [Pseudomonadota bacterium]
IIQQKSGCDIALHKVGKHFMDTKDDWSTWWRYYGQKAAFFNCTKPLEDGDVMGIGPHEFEVIYTPGHASDGVVLYHPKEKILLSSDTLWENDVAVMTLRVEGSLALFQMQTCLEKLESLDVRMVYPGHGRPFCDIGSALSNSKEKIEHYMLDREVLGNDLIKKIIVYTLLMKKEFKETEFFPYLMDTVWFKETCDLYFNSEYETKYKDIMNTFFKRGIIKNKNGCLFTIIKP